MTRYVKKYRKPSKWILEIAELVPLVNVHGNWVVHFDDHDRDQDGHDSGLADIVCCRRNAIVLLTRRPDLLRALALKAKELQDDGSGLKFYKSADRIIFHLARPIDVLAFAQVVARIEGRQLMPVTGQATSERVRS